MRGKNMEPHTSADDQIPPTDFAKLSKDVQNLLIQCNSIGNALFGNNKHRHGYSRAPVHFIEYYPNEDYAVYQFRPGGVYWQP
jgi:hypothetical protein